MTAKNKRRIILTALIFSVALSVWGAAENIFRQNFPSLVAAVFTGFVLIFAWDYLVNRD